MEMNKYLIDTFNYNDYANKLLLNKIKELPNKEECIKFFSHLINSQNKWLARVIKGKNAQEMSWSEPIYELNQLEEKWNDSLQLWTNYIRTKTEIELSIKIEFIGNSGEVYAASPQDIALQLNYHSIHHRAQMQTIIRQQGLTPDPLDYIWTVY
ncbi:MAG: putative damage-inducible protein DinB [Crocinitomicaceae bacterium]|jgi:uncharacterized damage-inducible protein DinB